MTIQTRLSNIRNRLRQRPVPIQRVKTQEKVKEAAIFVDKTRYVEFVQMKKRVRAKVAQKNALDWFENLFDSQTKALLERETNNLLPFAGQ